MPSELIDKLRLELRRGSLTIAVLAQLRAEHYGYTLRKALAIGADEAIRVNAEPTDSFLWHRRLQHMQKQEIMISS